MPIDKSEFQIHIGSSADLSGLDATTAKLRGQIEATKMLGKDTSDLEAQLQKVQQTKVEASLAGFTKGATEAGEGAKKGAEGMEEMIGGHHGIHAIGHALQQAMPGMLQFTRFLTGGFTAAIGVALLVFETFKERLEEFSKTLDTFDTPSARGEWAEKWTENVRAASIEEAVFNQALDGTLKRQDTLAQSTDRAIAANKARSGDAKSVADAQKALELARVGLAEKLGEISPEQAVKIRLEIDDKAFKEELQAEKQALATELSYRTQQRDTAGGNVRILQEHKDAAADQATAAANAQAANEAKLAQDQKQLETERAAHDEAQKKIEELEDKIKTEKRLSPLTMGVTGGMAGLNEIELKTLVHQQNQKEHIMAGLQTSIGQEKGKQTPLGTAAALSKHKAEEAAKALNEVAEEVKSASKDVDDLTAKLAALTARDNALQKIHDQRSQVAAESAHADEVKRIAAAQAHGSPGAHIGGPRSLEEMAAMSRQDAAPGPQPGMGGPGALGRASQQEIDTFEDPAIQSVYARQTGPQAGLNAADAVATGRRIISTLYGQHGPQQSDQMDELHSTLNQIVGFLQNHTANVQSQRNDLQDVRQKLRELESRMDIGRSTQ